MKILFLSHTAMNGPFVVGSHHLAMEMAKSGHLVVHASAPVTPFHFLMKRSPFERGKFKCCLKGGVPRSGVHELVPFALLPWGLVRRASWIRRWLYSPSAYIRRAMRRIGVDSFDLIVMDEPRMLDAANEIRASKKIYRPTDLYAEMRGDLSIERLEAEISCSQEYSIVAMSRPIQRNMLRLGAAQVSMMENGVDFQYFSQPGSKEDLPDLPAGPRAVYVGALDQRFSVESILSAANENPGVSFLIFGPEPELVSSRFGGVDNVYLMGPISYRKLPALLCNCDVALLPLSDHPANEGRSPMKIYEYGAAGLPVLATRTSELAQRGLPFVFLCDAPNDFGRTLRVIIDQKYSGEFSAEIARAAASEHSWSAKATVLTGNLNSEAR